MTSLPPLPSARSRLTPARRTIRPAPMHPEPPDDPTHEIHHGVDRALVILSLLGDHPAGLPLNVVSQRTAIAKPTVHRVLTTLKRRGFVHQPAAGADYLLGPAVLEAAFRFQADSPLITVIHPALVRLSTLSGLAVHLARLDAGQVVYLDKVNPRGGVRTSSVVGGGNPAHLTGVGKALLAVTLGPDEVDPWCRRHGPLASRTPRSIASATALRRELGRIRGRGYAVDDEESETGIMCVATTMTLSTGDVLGISVTGLASQVRSAGTPRLHDAVDRTISSIPYANRA